MVNTKRYGNIGEAMAISLFVKHGIPIAIPFGDNEKYDLIAEFNGKLNKIQVKTSITVYSPLMKRTVLLLLMLHHLPCIEKMEVRLSILKTI